MTKEQDNKAIVGRWFTDFWGKTCNLAIVDELAAPNMLLQYSLHAPRRGREDIKSFMTDFRRAFPDLNFWGAADLIAEGDYVVGRWEGGGTHTGPAFSDFLIGSLPPATGRKMDFTGTTVLRLENGKIVEEIGLDDGVTALQQLGLLKAARLPTSVPALLPCDAYSSAAMRLGLQALRQFAYIGLIASGVCFQAADTAEDSCFVESGHCNISSCDILAVVQICDRLIRCPVWGRMRCFSELKRTWVAR
jgi:predicted ester cyclase